MTNSNDNLEELRSLLYQEPSREVFEDLCDLFPDGQIGEVQRNYALTHIATWPSSVHRPVLLCWYDAHKKLFPCACLLSNCLEFSPATMPGELSQNSFALNNQKYLAHIVHLHISAPSFDGRNFILGSTFRSLRAQIQHLTITHSELGNMDILALANSTALTNIITLDLSHNLIGSSGATHLSKAHCIPTLRQLNLSHNQIDIQGAKALLEIESLEEIDLSYNTIFRESQLELLHASSQRNIYLYLHGQKPRRQRR